MFAVFPRYVLRRLLPWTAVCWFGASVLTLTTQLLRTASVFAGAPFSDTLRISALLSVPLAAFSMAPAFLAALFITAVKMGDDGELLAADALGLRRRHVQMLLICFAFAAALLNGVLWWSAAPSAMREARQIAVAALRTAAETGLTPGRFHHPLPGVSFFAEKRSATGVFEGVFIAQQTHGASFEAASRSCSCC